VRAARPGTGVHARQGKGKSIRECSYEPQVSALPITPANQAPAPSLRYCEGFRHERPTGLEAVDGQVLSKNLLPKRLARTSKAA
jgi:hypothetical protein